MIETSEQPYGSVHSGPSQWNRGLDSIRDHVYTHMRRTGSRTELCVVTLQSLPVRNVAIMTYRRNNMCVGLSTRIELRQITITRREQTTVRDYRCVEEVQYGSATELVP
jgi:hypothetical protein